MRSSKKFERGRTFWIIYCVALIFAVIQTFFLGLSCSEQQLKQADEVARDVNTVAQGTRAVLESPAGLLIPPEWKLYGALGAVLVNGLVIGWEEWRRRTMRKTTKAIVLGIEDTKNPDDITDLKTHIANEMIKQGGEKFYDRANKLVDRLKIA